MFIEAESCINNDIDKGRRYIRQTRPRFTPDRCTICFLCTFCYRYEMVDLTRHRFHVLCWQSCYLAFSSRICGFTAKYTFLCLQQPSFTTVGLSLEHLMPTFFVKNDFKNHKIACFVHGHVPVTQHQQLIQL